MLSLACILAESAHRHADRTAVVQGDTAVDYATLWRQARCYAAALREQGVKPGDRVALLAPNVLDFPRAYFAILALGAVVVPVHLLGTADETAYVLADSGASLLVTFDAERGDAAGRLAGVPVTTLAELAGRASTVDPVDSYASTAPEDPAVIFYTSGTTGEPKGAVLTHLNLVMNATVSAFDSHDHGQDDVVLGCLPLFHTYGQTVAMNASFRTGSTLILQPRFTGDGAIELMRRHGVTIMLGVPTMYVAMLQAAGGYDPADLPSPRYCVSGGASLPVAVLEAFNERFHTTIYEGYGLSETSPSATVNQPRFGTRAGTVGHPQWGVEVRVARAEVDDRIELVGTDELGEIVIRGHNVFAGYHNRPEATAEALVDGWFRSGDLGRIDADGFIWIVDRKKDLIIRGGFNVYPREIEEILVRHPAVQQAAVIGVPDPTYGEEICAVLVLDPDADPPSTEDIVGWSREHLGRHKYPRRVEIVDQLPLGPSFKVLKRELRKEFGG
jgi:long-chain acyl-CoA synthetase